MGWKHGRQLSTLHYGNKHANYTYNADGIRTKKTVNGVTTQYYLNGSQIMTQITEDKRSDFLYDDTGSVIGQYYNGVPYYYVKNLQGDIIGILDQTGMEQVSYRYDAWGKLISIDGIMKDTLGEDNPFRYRGYYYDTESKLYYLNSRYYDSETGRFINADGYVSTGQGVLGNNMYAYCANNPIMNVDPSGLFWKEIGQAIGNFFKKAASIVRAAVSKCKTVYAISAVAACSDGPLPVGDTIGAVVSAVATAGAIAYGVYQATRQTNSITASNSKTQDIATTTPPSSTVIYRFGGTNPGNLTPRLKDLADGRGLSFSTVPKPGCSWTTIEAINSTGVVYAVQDGPTHVSVYPVGGTMEDWYDAGKSSIWTQAVKSVVVKWDGVS